MTAGNFVQSFITEFKNTGAIEWTAALFGLAEVLLARCNKVLLYPAGIISSALYIYILHHAGLNAESWLNCYYVIMSVYGWYLWVKKKNETALPITKNTRRDWLITFLIVAVGWVIIFAILRWYNPSPVNGWDALVSATAWAGMWLLAKRKIENWVLLNISNLLAIPLFLYKKYPLTACLTLILFIVAIFGFIEWRKIYRSQRLASQS